MTILAYACINPTWEKPPIADWWGETIDCLYLDYVTDDGAQPELQQLLQICSIAPPQILYLRQIADLASSIEELQGYLSAWLNQGISVYYASHVTVTNPQGNFQLLTLDQGIAWGAIADELHASRQRRSLKAGHARNRLRALPPPGRSPYGYRRGRYQYALDRTAAPVVRAFFEQFLLYGSIRGAAKFLEKTYGKRISASTAQRWLSHPVYRGDLHYQDGGVLRDTHTPIISREEAAQVDRLLRRNRRLPPKTASAERSLAGLVYCAECGSKLTVSSAKARQVPHRYLYLRPMNCQREKPCSAIAYNTVLTQSISVIAADLTQAVRGLPQDRPRSPKAYLLAQIQQKEAAILQLSTLVQQGILDTPSADLRRYTLLSEIATLEQSRSQLPPENLLEIIQTLASEQFWQGLTEPERRVYFREFIREIQIVRSGESWQVKIQFVF
jgi:DNA invertase Pin-like site-specific DNA recombinase